MPLVDPALRTSLSAGVTGGETAEHATAWDRINKIVQGWGVRGAVVAASTTAAALKETADYVCDGTADQTEINSAIATGRPVLLLPGTFSVSASIAVPATWNGVFVGSGWTTKLQAANGLNDWVIKFSTTGGNVTGARFADFWVDGNASNQTAAGCIYAKGAVECIFQHIRYTAPYDAGLWCHEIASGNIGHHNRSLFSLYEQGTSSAGNGRGILWQASDENWSVFDQFSSMGGGGSNPWAIYDWSGINHIVHPTIVGGKGGIRGQDCSGTQLTGPMFDGLGQTALHIQGSGWTVEGGTWSGGGQDAANTYSHIVLDGSGGHSIIGGVHSTDATAGRLRSFIRELGASSSNTVVTGKRFVVNGSLGTAKVERNAQANLYQANSGYETSASGAATVLSGSTSVAVTHGLDVTPTLADIHVTPTNNLGNAAEFWTSAPTSTTFTINVNVDPGVSTATFSWSVGQGAGGGSGIGVPAADIGLIIALGGP